jgi:hypothetical protein
MGSLSAGMASVTKFITLVPQNKMAVKKPEVAMLAYTLPTNKKFTAIPMF